MSHDAKIAAIRPAAASPEYGDAGGGSDRQPSSQSDRQTQYRLVIEEGPTRGSFIYKTLDAVTGEVVRQLPREQVVQMMQSDAYSAGALIDTTA